MYSVKRVCGFLCSFEHFLWNMIMATCNKPCRIVIRITYYEVFIHLTVLKNQCVFCSVIAKGE